MDNTLTEELNVKFIENPDADWNQCIKFIDEKMQVAHPIIGRRLKAMKWHKTKQKELADSS